MKLEDFLLYLSVLAIASVGLYVFYSFFSGKMGGEEAVAIIIVSCASFGFIIAVANLLAGYRKAGWEPEREGGKRQVLKAGVGERRPSSILPDIGRGPLRYRTYKRTALAFLLIGLLAMALSPPLGLVVVIISAISYAGLRAIEIFEQPGAY